MSDGPIETPAEPTADIVETPDAQGQQPQAGEQENTGGNPAWQPFLDKLPTSLHSQVTPLLQEWDKGVQQRFDAIHQEYADYKPLKEKGIDPQTVEYALGIVEALNENPRQVWESMAEYYNFTPAEQQAIANAQAADSGNEWDQPEETPIDPRIAKLEEGVQLMAQMLLQEQQAKEQAAEDQQLNQELASLKEKHGEYDEQYVLGRMLNGDTAEQAVNAYKELVNKVASENNRPSAPKVMGSGGGGVASNVVDPAKLTDAQRKALVANMLQKAAQEG